VCKVCKVRSVDYNAERSRMTARLCGKVCKESMQCVQARVFAHTRTHLPPKSRACAKKGRLDTSARCRQKGPSPCVCVLPSRALHTLHTLSQAAAKKYASPEAATPHSCLLLHTLHTFHTLFEHWEEYKKKRGAREVDAVHTHHYTPSEFGKKCAKYAKCAR